MIIRGKAESVSIKYQSDMHADPVRSTIIAFSRPVPIIRNQGDQKCSFAVKLRTKVSNNQ